MNFDLQRISRRIMRSKQISDTTEELCYSFKIIRSLEERKEYREYLI